MYNDLTKVRFYVYLHISIIYFYEVIDISRVVMNLIKDNVKHNVNVIKNVSKKDIIAVVKDNAYSHGSREVVSILNEIGVSYYAVSTISELIEISDLSSNILLPDFSIAKIALSYTLSK